jgi:hypothetical protein
MSSLRAAAAWALLLAAPASAQDQERPHKSVYGTLEHVDRGQNSVVMQSDAGERRAWRFDAKVIAEAARFKPGDAMIVIYRQVSPSEKRVTALAFPGAAKTPTYVNMTGASVAFQSAPAAAGACGRLDVGPLSASTIPIGGRAESLEACWCCAPAGGHCAPGNRSGVGLAFLVGCFF